MAAEEPTNTAPAAGEEEVVEKGKGKAVAEPTEDTAMDQDDDESSSEEENEETNENAEEDDGMEEIDLKNIVDGGRRTRGRVIDWAKAAEDNPAQDNDDEEDDEEYKAPEEKNDRMDTD